MLSMSGTSEKIYKSGGKELMGLTQLLRVRDFLTVHTLIRKSDIRRMLHINYYTLEEILEYLVFDKKVIITKKGVKWLGKK